ncbi:MAG: hypothetical protein ABFR33_00300 [Verrucomicrobiota bacterium]
MKNTMTRTVAAGMVAAWVGTAFAEVGVTADFASAYVFRGATFNDGFVVQPGIEASGLGLPEEYGSVAAGAWGNFDVDDYGGTLAGSEFSEIDWYASYSLPNFVDGLDLFVGFTEYTYPTAASVADKEVNLGVGYEIAGIALGATTYLGVGGGINGNAYYDLSAAYAYAVSKELELSVGALVGYFDPDTGTAGWNDGVFDLAASYALGETWSVGASVAYIAQLDDAVLVDVGKGGAYDVDFVGMLSFGAAF